ncbi:disulfide bond formation protein [Rathayibacter rathayi]|uniref:Disulfide bond formation protein n=1 Tax=Rathayibacter rathayi TaxID=33887 RepID=A0ABX5A7P5_RATRA|nr:thioredoxin domain-containing protein [Rathayibacter rathayi]AZZ49875.1 disulfide bond formation protein [Rathayibacter rathayi]MWV75946.1 thioredoxin domain-containing protein [Rathayibacter rathayi NCPPB 2980 = VKM Ac-1601]PPF50602.1 disulfide bond formation protein [Rathayibacter rathayi]PPF75242.1 disulfide bond formation protein [Rathayibacter rathayi]PPG36852.1 disulfide bond formation protein [Rathayibacter rathayi]
MSRPHPSVIALEARLRRTRILLVAVIAVALFLGVVALGQAGSASSPLAAPSPAAAAAQRPSIERRDAADPAAIGALDAPVVLTEWTDLRCPFCAQFGRETLPTLVHEYVDTGKVRIEFRDVAFFGEQSDQASVAARAAGRQGLFAAYLDTVFRAAPESGHPDLPREKLLDFARDAQVPDLARFEADLDDPALLAAVKQDTVDAQRLGATSVPFFAASGTAVSGAQPIERFRTFLDAALAGA